jgi:hypothetical protein
VGKHTDQLGSIENYQAPWETAAGEVEIDKDRLKRYIFNLALDKAKAQDARDETSEKVTETEKALEAAKAEVAKGDPSGKIAALEADLAKAKSDAEAAQGNLNRLNIGLEKGLTPAQAARLQGSTEDELKADADKLLADFGVKPATNETDEEREEREEKEREAAEEAANGRQTPRFVNPADPKVGSGEQEYDFDKIAADITSRGVYIS